VSDVDGLAIALVDTMAPVYLLHREHGGTGIAPGRYAVRRQRELVRPAPVRHQPQRKDMRQDHGPGRERPATVLRQRPRVRLVAD
jgi:hypothetical protein